VNRGRAAALALLLLASAYLAAVLGAAIPRTGFLEQDAAYYCEVAERALAGEGFTSLSDRRGPSGHEPLPHPFTAASRYPWLLAGLGFVTGEVPLTGTILSLLALLGTLWLGARLLARGLGVTPWIAAAVVAIALCQRWSLRAALLPETDALSLCVNVAVLAALLERRLAWIALLLPIALLIRFQNVALAFPIAAVLLASRPRLRRLLLAAGVAAGFGFAGLGAVEGLLEAFWPWHEDSLFRALRWLFVPAVIGIAVARGGAGLAPLLWFGFGHLLVLLANQDPNSQHEWLFGIRHGMPFQIVAAAGAGVALMRTRGWLRAVTALLLLAAAADNLPRPWKLARDWPERTAAPGLAQMIAALRAEPLPPGSVVLCHDSDVLALYLRQPALHSRGFALLPPAELVPHLRARGATHVLLTWVDKPVLRAHNETLDRMLATLTPAMQVARIVTHDDPPARSLLLSWSP
jgi:hypothetical protein